MNLGSRLQTVFIILVLCLTVLPIYQIPPISADLSNETALKNHNTIHINGNSQFNLTNGVVSGSGMMGDPYIIENWTIDATNNTGVWIENIDVYFIVRNCYIFNGTNGSSNYYGIWFNNVSNGTIQDNRISNNLYGIFFYESDGNKIINNTIENIQYQGFYTSHSDYNEISNNIISNCNLSGMELYVTYNPNLRVYKEQPFSSF